MICRDFVDFIDAYLERALSDAEVKAFEDHLHGCAACARYLETYRETIWIGKKAFEDPSAPVPEEVPEDLVQAILAAKRKSKGS